MKKTLIALAALAATASFAQVTVYGRLDAGYAVTTNTANGVDSKANGVQSHNSVSSMWGLKGTEDLGGGMNAFFILEQDIFTANGNLGVSGGGAAATLAPTGTNPAAAPGTPGATNAAVFDRTSLVGLNGGFGSIAFGRDYNPVFKLIGATDVNALSRISTVQSPGAAGGTSQSNLVFYSTPDLSGFKLNVAYGNTDNSSGTTDTYNKVTNVTATYTNGPLMVGVGTGSTEVRSTTVGAAGTTLALVGSVQNAALGTVDKVVGNVLAASYDFGKFKLAGNAVTNTNKMRADAPGLLAGTDVVFSEMNLGITAPMGKVTLIGQIGTNKITISGQDDMTGNDFVVGVDYNLSAKTALFAKTGTYAKFSGAGNDFKSTSSAIGIKTSF